MTLEARSPWCFEPGCGRKRTTAGKPRDGWVAVRVAGRGGTSGDVWYCSTGHAALALLGEDAMRASATGDMPDALRRLNELARTHLTVMTVTPVRLRATIEKALSRILAELAEWQAAQDRRRPTTVDLLGEATTGRIDDIEHEPEPEDVAETG